MRKKPGCLGCTGGLYYHILPSCVCFCFLGSFVSDKQSCHVWFFKPQAAIVAMRVVLSLLVGLNSFLWNGDLDKNGVGSDWAVWNKKYSECLLSSISLQFYWIFYSARGMAPIHVDVGIGSADAVCDSGNQKPPRLFCLGMWGNRLKNVTLKSVLSQLHFESHRELDLIHSKVSSLRDFANFAIADIMVYLDWSKKL